MKKSRLLFGVPEDMPTITMEKQENCDAMSTSEITTKTVISDIDSKEVVNDLLLLGNLTAQIKYETRSDKLVASTPVPAQVEVKSKLPVYVAIDENEAIKDLMMFGNIRGAWRRPPQPPHAVM